MYFRSLEKYSKFFYLVSLACFLVLVTQCADEQQKVVHQMVYSDYMDSSITVFGQYRVLKLPITKGVPISNPIQIGLSSKGVLFVANQTGEIYTLHDSDEDQLEDSTALFCNVRDYGLRSPAGLAFKGDTLFVGASQQIRAFLDTDSDGKADKSWVFFDRIPQSEHPYEWTSGLSFAADGSLYVALTTDSWNAAPSPDPEGYRGAILRISPDGQSVERMATGIRSVPDMAFDPNGDLFFMDNEGGGNPTEELNKLEPNAFYGHNPKKYKHDEILKPVFDLETEVAPSGMVFNAMENDFGGTAGQLFVAYYGPGERWNRGGIGRVVMEKTQEGDYHFDEYMVADIPKLSDLAFGRDGSLYAVQHGKADYWYNAIYENQGAIYKIIYDPSLPQISGTKREKPAIAISEKGVETGKRLFAELACLGCHQVDGVTELLGPNLKDVGLRFSREEILSEIVQPSARITPSMMAVKITKDDGQVLLGRVINADENLVSLMVVGNFVLDVPRTSIAKIENETKSLMLENLLYGVQEDEIESLLDFMISLSQ